MRFALFGALAATAFAQAPIEVEIVGTAANHQLSWTTTVNYNYQVFMSPDLENWLDTGIAEPGTGSTIAYGLMSTADKLFYRIHETADPYNGGFLVLPVQDQEFALEDGVCFSFNLDVLPALPSKIRIYQRVYDSGDPWEQIGSLTDFVTIDGVRTLRGSAVWLPDEEGEYEVQAAVVDATGSVIASAVRRVIVGSNEPPTITITAGPSSPSASRQRAEFTTVVADPDGDDIARVEFFDNGILIGTDREAPYGDEIRDLEDLDYDLLRGTHDITAKAYDVRGGVGETTSAFQVVITGGNARPTLTVTSPAEGTIVTAGQPVTVAYTEGDPDGATDLFEVRAEDSVSGDEEFDGTAPFADLVFDTTGWESGIHRIKVIAEDNTGDTSYPMYLSVFIRSGAGQTFAERLVENIVDEATAAPANETFVGVELSSDEFSDGLDSGLQMDSGVLLTSGRFEYWDDGDDGSGQDSTAQIWNSPGDEQLGDRAAAGGITNDAAVLEFDAFCDHGQLEIEFQFGSEEYDEFVFDEVSPGCYNDAFLILVDGVPVSLTPDCLDIVAVNSVHQFIPADHPSCTGLDVPAVRDHLFLDDDDDIDPSVLPANQSRQVEYDGMTIRLKAHVFVTPNQFHNVKIVVADAVDANYDAGVFVEESSVRTVVPTP